MDRAVILFGHGSRDPLWRLPMQAVAARLRALQPATPVRCAFLELEAPNLLEAAGELVAGGTAAITIVPMFFGTGRHARAHLPVLVDRLRSAHPQVAFTLQQPVGEDERVVELIAKIALE